MIRVMTNFSYFIGTVLWAWVLLHGFTRSAFFTIPHIFIPKPEPEYVQQIDIKQD